MSDVAKLLERIEYMTGSGRPIGPDSREKINDLARAALAALRSRDGDVERLANAAFDILEREDYPTVRTALIASFSAALSHPVSTKKEASEDV